MSRHAAEPFFLYAPLSHVHTTEGNMPEMQYAGCAWRGVTRRGAFGDALAEADELVGALVAQARERTFALHCERSLSDPPSSSRR